MIESVIIKNINMLHSLLPFDTIWSKNILLYFMSCLMHLQLFRGYLNLGMLFRQTCVLAHGKIRSSFNFGWIKKLGCWAKNYQCHGKICGRFQTILNFIQEISTIFFRILTISLFDWENIQYLFRLSTVWDCKLWKKLFTLHKGAVVVCKNSIKIRDIYNG